MDQYYIAFYTNFYELYDLYFYTVDCLIVPVLNPYYVS